MDVAAKLAADLACLLLLDAAPNVTDLRLYLPYSALNAEVALPPLKRLAQLQTLWLLASAAPDGTHCPAA